jgi:sulfide:quinone oxidoreductase
MDARKLSDEFSVSPQVDVSELDEIVKAGFKSVLCNRPDGEEYGQPDYEDVAKAAEGAGLEVRSVPIVSGMVTPQAAQDFAQALEEMPKPILAYCRSGTRCTMLWSLVKYDDLGAEEILKATQAAGYDMSGLVRQLQAR